MPKEEIQKKVEEIMCKGEIGSLSDYDFTTYVALEIAKFVEKTTIENACKWMHFWGLSLKFVELFKEYMEKK